jgi:hypothetical protein
MQDNVIAIFLFISTMGRISGLGGFRDIVCTLDKRIKKHWAKHV